jgi:hypothetical protein
VRKINDKDKMDLDKTTVVGIFGDRNSGKTNLAVHLLREYKGKRKIYVFGYPKPIDDFEKLEGKSEINNRTDSIIFIDEFASVFPLYERHSNKNFIELAKKLTHTNNTIIFTTQTSQDLTKEMEIYVDAMCITRTKNLKLLKDRSKIKMVIDNLDNTKKSSTSLDLSAGQYYEWIESDDKSKSKTFPFQNIGKDWNGLSVASSDALSDAFADARKTGHKHRYTENKLGKPNISLQELEEQIKKLSGKPNISLQELEEQIKKLSGKPNKNKSKIHDT